MNDEVTEPPTFKLLFRETWTNLEQAVTDVQEASEVLRPRLGIEEPDVTVPTDVLRRLLDGMNIVVEIMNDVMFLRRALPIQEKRSLASLYRSSFRCAHWRDRKSPCVTLVSSTN